MSNNNVQDVMDSPVRGQHSIEEPDEVDGSSSAAHDLQVMNNARLPQYDRDSTMDTYIQSYLEVSLSHSQKHSSCIKYVVSNMGCIKYVVSNMSCIKYDFHV